MYSLIIKPIPQIIHYESLIEINQPIPAIPFLHPASLRRRWAKHFRSAFGRFTSQGAPDGAPWRLAMPSGASWWLMMVHGGSWPLLLRTIQWGFIDNSCWLMMVTRRWFDGIWGFALVFWASIKYYTQENWHDTWKKVVWNVFLG